MVSYEKYIGPTPNGGDYSEIYYFDDAGKPADKEQATRCVIRECLNDGTLVGEINGLAGGT